MPIPLPVARPTLTPALNSRSRRRIDPWIVLALGLLVAVTTWTMAPLATGAIGSDSSDTTIQVEVPITTSVTPGWQAGTARLRLPNISIPGKVHDVTSRGWRLSTNWVNGYEVRIRATSDPALRGTNAVDGDAARASFQDFHTKRECPCPWAGTGFDQGVYGYSVSVRSSSGEAASDASKWGDARARRWRGFSRTPYRAYATSGGTGEYSMSIHLRSMIPQGASQPQGSYRSGLVVSAHPLL